ncbi:MAG: DUF2189 domain-containing protein [Alphaproteobacteria bacterium]|nr:DUF2189 domain-containing protein [Alphaproteobacteria bacterium]
MMDSVFGEAVDYSEARINRITVRDVREALRKGFEDYKINRTDVLFLCLIYPLLMYLVVRLAFGYGVIPLIFPVIAGSALLGPLVAVGLYHVSWRREQGLETHWRDAFRVFRLPSIGGIAILGCFSLALFMAWLVAALTIYRSTMGAGTVWQLSLREFIGQVLSTPEGWAMIVIGNAVGFVFAAAVLCFSVVSFPMLVDRPVGPVNAVLTSLRAVAANPVPVAVWGLIVAALLILGSIPFFVGLAVVMPILGHATWHLYRRMVHF